MPAPVPTSVSPSYGLAVGDVFVEIAGTGFYLQAQGSVKVTFGGVPALRVGVVSSTRVLAVAPGGNPDAGTDPNKGKVDVVVENFDTLGVSQGSATLVKAFQYRRPVIAYPDDFSNHPALALVTRTLVAELQRTVIKNVWDDMHPEYAGELAAAIPTPELAALPSLKIVGPRIRDDPLRSDNEPRLVDLGGGDFATAFAARAVELEYTLVGVGRDPTEAAHLWTECKRFFEHTDFLSVTIPSSRFGTETAVLELEPDWKALGEFRGKSTRQGIAQFNMVFHVRGLIPTGDRKIWASKWVDLVELQLAQKPIAATSAEDLDDDVPVEVLEVVLPDGADLRETLEDLENRLERTEADSPRPVAFTFGLASPVFIYDLKAGDVLEEVSVVVLTPFNAPAANTLLVGTVADPELIFAAGEIPADVAGEYRNDQSLEIESDTQLRLTINPGASTQGVGYVLFRVRR